MSVTCFVFESYTASCRPLVLRGNKTAEGWPEPSLQNAGFSLGRILEVIQTRPAHRTLDCEHWLGCARWLHRPSTAKAPQSCRRRLMESSDREQAASLDSSR